MPGHRLPVTICIRNSEELSVVVNCENCRRQRIVFEGTLYTCSVRSLFLLPPLANPPKIGDALRDIERVVRGIKFGLYDCFGTTIIEQERPGGRVADVDP